MKRFITVLSSLLVLPAFAEVAPVYYDEIVEYTDEMLDAMSFLGKEKVQLASFLPISLPGLDAERLIYALEDKEVYLSTGAACAASKGIKSPTLVAIGLSDSEISGSLRITMGEGTNEAAIEAANQAIHEVVEAELSRLAK